MKHILLSSIALAAATLLLTETGAQAGFAYSLADNGTSLIKFDLAAPGAATLVGAITGVGGRLDGIDFRPADGLLYAYSAATNGIYTLDLTTAVATFASTPATASSTGTLGIDFNPVADRMRLVNLNDQNLRINVANGATLVDGTLAYAVGDANFGANPGLNEAAYTNSDTNGATGTALYYIDSDLDTLVTTANPNGGTLNTVGSLGISTSDLTGFDILSDGIGGNTAYALLTASSGTASLFTVNLATGAATAVGVINPPGGTARPFSLAVVQPVPEPGTALFGLALLGVGMTRRNSRRQP